MGVGMGLCGWTTYSALELKRLCLTVLAATGELLVAAVMTIAEMQLLCALMVRFKSVDFFNTLCQELKPVCKIITIGGGRLCMHAHYEAIKA